MTNILYFASTHLYDSRVWSRKWYRHNYLGRPWADTQHRCWCIRRTENSPQSQTSPSAAERMERREKKNRTRLHNHTMAHKVANQSVPLDFSQGSICFGSCSHTVCTAHRFPRSWRSLRRTGILPCSDWRHTRRGLPDPHKKRGKMTYKGNRCCWHHKRGLEKRERERVGEITILSNIHYGRYFYSHCRKAV